MIAGVRAPSSFSGDAVAVDFADIDALAAAYQDVDGIFVHLPIGSPDQQLAHAQVIVEAVRRARPARVVASTSGYPAGGDGDSPVDVLVRGLEDSGVSVAIVEPRLYLENLLLPMVTGPTKEDGVLRYPIRDDYAVSWASHLDVADVVVRLFQDPSIVGVVAVGALPGLLGEDLADGFARYLSREVVFEAQTPDEFGALITPMFGEAGSAPVVASYQDRLAQPDELVRADVSAQSRLGLQPRSVEQWLRDVQA